MSRREEIEKAAKDFFGSVWDDHEVGYEEFVQGAKWADKTNPEVQQFKSKCFSLTEVVEQRSRTHELELIQLRVRVDELTEALKSAREQFALMAEGEGDDPNTYRGMSLYQMKECDKALEKGRTPDAEEEK